MSEDKIVELVEAALREHGVEDQVLAAGEFNPRGHTGGLFVGGLSAAEAGSALGNVGEDVGLVVGSLGGMHAADTASGLPGYMVVAVTATNVYGFAGRRSHPGDLVFDVPRAGLEAKVHQRVNVRVLELIHDGSGSTIELEGNRVPLTHSKDVIAALTS